MGNFQAGWAGYERRWDQECTAAEARCLLSNVEGEELRGKRIIVYEEQGLGDIIQFSRFLTRLSSLGASVTFLVHSSMHRLFQPFISMVRLIDKPPTGETFDFQSALLSLASVFGTTINTVPSGIPYLLPEPALVAHWGKRIGGHGLKIGICWQGNPYTGSIKVGPFRCDAFTR